LILAITIVIASLSDHHDSNGAEQHGTLDQPRFVFSDQSGPLGDMAFSQDGKVLAAVVRDGTVKVWNVATGASAGTLTGHADQDSNLALSPDGKVLAVSTASARGFATVKLWTVATGTLTTTITGNGAAYSLAFSPEGGTLAIANTLAAGKRYDNPIRLWDTASGHDAGELAGHSNGIEALAFSPDGRLLASGGSGQNPVRVWNLASHKLEATLTTDVTAFAGALAFGDGDRTLVSMRGEVVQLWDVARTRLTATLTKNTGDVLAVGPGPGRTALAAGGGDPVVLWDVATGKPWRTLSVGDPAKVIAFGPDGQTLATGDQGGTVKLWDIGS
jgi:WD40 repeat protein